MRFLLAAAAASSDALDDSAALSDFASPLLDAAADEDDDAADPLPAAAAEQAALPFAVAAAAKRFSKFISCRRKFALGFATGRALRNVTNASDSFIFCRARQACRIVAIAARVNGEGHM